MEQPIESFDEVLEEAGINKNDCYRIYPSWNHHILKTTPNGRQRPYSDAILLLMHFFYMHIPIEVYDPATGTLLGYQARFHGDKCLQSHKEIKDFFRLSEHKLKKAMHYLASRGFIVVEPHSPGFSFVTVVPKKISEITYDLGIRREDYLYDVDSPAATEEE